MAAITSNCIIKSETLIAGEKFVLPPGATLLGSTDNGAFTSTCPIPTLESLTCFHLALTSGVNGSSSRIEYHEPGQVNIEGFLLGGVYTAFTTQNKNSNNGKFDMTKLFNDLKAKIPAIISGATGYLPNQGNGMRSQLAIKTFPSIGNNLKIVLTTNANVDANAAAQYQTPFLPYADAATIYGSSVTSCPS